MYLQHWLTHEVHNSEHYFADNFVPKGTLSTKSLRSAVMLALIKIVLHVKWISDDYQNDIN